MPRIGTVKYRKRNLYDFVCRLTLAAIFLSYSLLPQSFAFALLKDCGPHEYQPCEEHEDSHLILVHDDGTASDSSITWDSGNTDPSHDTSHQIDEKTPLNVFTSKQLTDHYSSFVALVVNEFLLPSLNRYKHQYHSLDPPRSNFDLFLLKTVRLLV